MLHYDDRLAGFIDGSGGRDIAPATLWAQLTDILAQTGARIDPALASRAIVRLKALRPQVPTTVRARAGAAVARRCRYLPLIQLYARDEAAVAVPLLNDLRLDDADWHDFIAGAGPLARAILRRRGDLGDTPMRALALFETADFSLPMPEVVSPTMDSDDDVLDELLLDDSITFEKPSTLSTRVLPQQTDSQSGTDNDGGRAPDAASSQISELVRRIEQFRRDRDESAASPAKTPDDDRFLFETDAAGLLVWTDDPQPSALVGLSIAEPALAGGSGVDAAVAGAFQARSPIHQARLVIETVGRLGGDWRISATPLFDQQQGDFLGYRGTARRPLAGETAETGTQSRLLRSDILAHSMRQVVHELRTPLNAISGFAQIIAGQMFGPVPERYQAMAEEINADAGRLVAIIDDLDLAARLDVGSWETAPGISDVSALMRATLAYAKGPGGARYVAADGRGDMSMLPVAIAPRQAERLLNRLASALLAVADDGETLSASLEQAGEVTAVVAFMRPVRIATTSEAMLLDPGFAPPGEAADAPMLSLGFSLRLVANLAAAVGGSMAVEPGRIALYLPLADGLQCAERA